MVQLFLHTFIPFYITVPISIPQVKMWAFFRFHIVPQLPAVIEEPAFRVQRKGAHFDGLLVQGEVSFVEVSAGAQRLSARWRLTS